MLVPIGHRRCFASTPKRSLKGSPPTPSCPPSILAMRDASQRAAAFGPFCLIKRGYAMVGQPEHGRGRRRRSCFAPPFPSMAHISWTSKSFDLKKRTTAMLDLRPNCECCNKDLPPDAADALICSFECTFCTVCAETKLGGRCPNCGGEFQARPIRPPDKLRKFPASAVRVFHPERCGNATTTS
jgi:uncharacterized protein